MFEVKDSGKREQFSGGMVRDVEDNKTDYTFILDGPMFDRWAEHMTKGAKKYGDRNWMKANGEEELARFRRSALRHMRQWMRGDKDEDHASAVFFNINAYEWLKEKMRCGAKIVKSNLSNALSSAPVVAQDSWPNGND